MIKNLTIISLAIVLFSSCASHIGMISSNCFNSNVEYQDIAIGVSQTSKLFGIGATSKDALVLEAKRNLVINHPLKPGQQYANYTVDFKRSFYFIYFQNKVTVSADVVAVNKNNKERMYTEDYLNKLSQKLASNQLFNIGDSVIFSDDKIASIIDIENGNKLRLLYKTKNGKVQSFKKSMKDVYVINKSYNNLNIGDIIKYKTYQDKQETQKMGKIVAFGINKIMVTDNIKNTIRVKYEHNLGKTQ